MSKHTRWLEQELEQWTADEIVTPEQAARIRSRYAAPADAISWGLIVFSGIGAAVVGLGVILLLAYNWDEIPKFGKLALVFGGIAAAHAAGLRCRSRGGWVATLGEVLSLLGTMGFGAGIWLVAQVYHIDEHFPNGFLIWALGAVAMAWALDSVLHAMLAAVLLAIWGGCEALGFHSPADASSLLLVVVVMPLVIRRQSAVLLATVLAALYWLLLLNAMHRGGSGAMFANAFALAVLLIGLAHLVPPSALAERGRGVLAGFGWTAFVLCAYLLSFHRAVRSTLTWDYADTSTVAAGIYRWLLFALAVAAWVAVLVRIRRGELRIALEAALCPIALIYAQALTVLNRHDSDVIAIVFNLACLGVALAWMVRGCREGRLRPTVVGSILLSAVLLARYFDLFDSLALRGVAFLVLGGILFAEGFYYRKLRRLEAAA